MKFYYSTTCINDSFFTPVIKGAKDAASLFACEVAFEGTQDVDVETQIEMIRGAIRRGYSGIAVSAAHPTRYRKVLDEAAANGIPVVGFTLENKTPGILSCVCQDTYAAGHAFARRAGKNLQVGSHVLLTVHTDGVEALHSRIKGIRDGLAHKNIFFHTLTADTCPAVSARIIEDKLVKSPEICAVLGTGQPDTEGIVNVLGGGRTKIYAAGFDLSARIVSGIENGTLDFSIDQQPYIQGYIPVVQLYMYRRFGIRPASIDSGAGVIDRSNVSMVSEANIDGYNYQKLAKCLQDNRLSSC